jgi:hypothetical protein
MDKIEFNLSKPAFQGGRCEIFGNVFPNELKSMLKENPLSREMNLDEAGKKFGSYLLNKIFPKNGIFEETEKEMFREG